MTLVIHKSNHRHNDLDSSDSHNDLEETETYPSTSTNNYLDVTEIYKQ